MERQPNLKYFAGEAGRVIHHPKLADDAGACHRSAPCADPVLYQ
jgi:hypothetical protein